MAITFVAAESNPKADGGTVTVTKPTGTTEDDFILAFSCNDDGDDTTTLPSGFTAIRQAGIDNGSGTLDSYFNLGYKIAGASEPADYSLTESSVEPIVAGIAVWRGVDTTTPLDVSHTLNEGDTNEGVNRTAPSITPVTNGCAIIHCIGTEVEGTCQTPPTGFTLVINRDTETGEFITTGAGIHVGWDIQDTAQSTGTKTYEGDDGVGDSYNAVTLALRPAVTGPIERTLTDSIDSDDADSSQFDIPLSATLATEDQTFSLRSLFRLAADSIDTDDSLAVSRQALRIMRAGVDTADTSTASLAMLRALVDGIATDDQLGLSLDRVMTDSLATEDEQRQARQLVRLMIQGVDVADDEAVNGILSKRVLDSVELLDSSAAARDLPRSMIDTLSVSEFVSAVRELLLEDSITVEDRVETLSRIFVTLGASIEVDDFIGRAAKIERQLQSAVTVDDREDAIRQAVRLMVSSTSIEDAAASAFMLALSSSVDADDNAITGINLARLIQDGVATEDDLSRVTQAYKDFREAVDADDQIAAGQVVSNLLQDTIGVGDSVSSEVLVVMGLGVVTFILDTDIETDVVEVN